MHSTCLHDVRNVQKGSQLSNIKSQTGTLGAMPEHASAYFSFSYILLCFRHSLKAIISLLAMLVQPTWRSCPLQNVSNLYACKVYIQFHYQYSFQKATEIFQLPIRSRLWTIRCTFFRNYLFIPFQSDKFCFHVIFSKNKIFWNNISPYNCWIFSSVFWFYCIAFFKTNFKVCVCICLTGNVEYILIIMGGYVG